MSNRSSRGLRRDPRGVSEVISYILGFLMAFLILSTSLYAFSIVSENGRTLNGQAQMKNVANRVALAVQESLLIGTQRRDSAADAATDVLHYERRIFVPTKIEGLQYTVTLTADTVRVQSTSEVIIADAPTFNAAAILPVPPDPCTAGYAVCELTGTVLGESGQILITYDFVDSPILNRIEIR